MILAMMKFLLTTFSGVKKSSVTAEPKTIQSSLSNDSKATMQLTPSIIIGSIPFPFLTILSIVVFNSLLSS